MNFKKANIDWDSLGFNPIETRSMFIANCPIDGKWESGSLVPYGKIELSPAAGVLNYGQGVFEGTKAYHTVKNNIDRAPTTPSGPTIIYIKRIGYSTTTTTTGRPLGRPIFNTTI